MSTDDFFDGADRGVALVTGAARRIGRAIAVDLAARGWRVALHCHESVAQAEDTLEMIEAIGGEGAIFEADFGVHDQVVALLPKVAATLGPVTCLVNNSAIFERDSIDALSQSSWDRHHAVNLRAPVFLAQAFAAALPRDQHGVIINMIDQRVWKLTPEYTSYTLSKAGLWAATRTLAQALAPRIRVNAIGPGPTLRNARQSDDDFAAQQRGTLLKRGPEPDEIAAAVRFILDTPSLTGQMIALDGGQHLLWQTPDILNADD